MKEEHLKEFTMYDKFTATGKSTTKLVYVMAVLADVLEMKQPKEIKDHIQDVREMLGIIIKEVAKLENIPIVGE